VTDLEGKSVIITGGSKGIGRETARVFLQAGASVTITGRSEESLKRTLADLKRIGPPVFGLTADVSIEEDCRRTVKTVIEQFGQIDILVNNAGMSARGIFKDTDIGLYKTLIGINFLGPVMMSHLCLQEICKARGSIIYISTLAALKGLPGLSHYSSSKMPLTAFSESIRGELKPEGVHVGTIYVGFTGNDPDKTIYDSRGNRIPLKRARNSMTQQDVAQSVFKAVIHRRKTVTLSLTGKLASFLYRFFPGLSEAILAGQTMKSPQYQSET
jgi:dehydrogenase/reductase SDR family protein 7B